MAQEQRFEKRDAIKADVDTLALMLRDAFSDEAIDEALSVAKTVALNILSEVHDKEEI